MQIKRFEARDMTTALGLIKQEFGPDAVILSAKTLKPSGSLLGKTRSSRVAVTAAIDPAIIDGPPVKAPPVKAATAKGGARPAKAKTARKIMANLNQRVHNIYGRDGKPSAPMTSKPDLASVAETVEQLVEQGVLSDVAADVGRQIAAQAGVSTDSIETRLSRVLAEQRLLAGRLRPSGEGPVVTAVLGNAGAGKTSVIAKWAAIHAIDHGHRVGIISLDDRRVGAGDQINTLARLIDVPVKVIDAHQDLTDAMADWDQMDFIFVDTPGLSMNHPDRYHRLCRQLEPIAGLELHLVVSASTHSRETSATIERFDRLPIRSVVFTHLDACCLLGQLLDTIWTHRVPISYTTAGDTIPDDIQIVTADTLASLVLNGDRTGLIAAQPEKPAHIAIHTDKTEASRAPSIDPASAPFLANNNSDIFHRADCKWTAMIKPKNTIAFESTDEAGQKGFAPCRYCRPAELESIAMPKRVAHYR